MCVLSIGYIWNGIESTSWPNVQGTVLHTTIERFPSQDGMRASSISYVPAYGGMSASSVIYFPVINYQYFVDNKEYFGNCHAFGEHYYGYDDAKKVVDSFPVGSQTTVYYHLRTPQKSVLKPGLTGGAIIKCCLSIVFLMSGILMYVMWSRQYTRRRAALKLRQKRLQERRKMI